MSEEERQFGQCVVCRFGSTEAEYIALCGAAPPGLRNRVRIDGALYCPDCAREKRQKEREGGG